MKDFVSLGNGDSRYMKSAISADATWEQFRDMLRAGTFPFDFNGINPAGVAEQGTSLNKANLLNDATGESLDLIDYTVNEALSKIPQMGNIHVWKRESSGNIDYLMSFDENKYQEGTSGYIPAKVELGNKHTNFSLYSSTYSDSTIALLSIYYSKTLDVTESGSIATSGTSETLGRNTISTEFANKIRNNYIKLDYPSYSDITTDLKDGKWYYVPATATLKTTSSKPYTATISEVYECVGVPASYDSRITYLGQLGAGMTKIETGSYAGTGTYGSSNPNELTFEFEPTIVIIYKNNIGLLPGASGSYGGSWNYSSFFIKGVNSYSSMSDGNRPTRCDFELSKTLSWYSSKDTKSQLNENGSNYSYIAIG